MKKILFPIIAIATIFTSCDMEHFNCSKDVGQTTSKTLQLSKTPDSFDFRIAGDVYISKGDEFSVVAEGPSNMINDLKTNVNSFDKWNIDYEHNWCSSESVTIYITTNNLEGMRLSGSGNIYMMDQFEQNDFGIVLSGSGNIDAQIDTDDLDVLISGSGNINITGLSEETELDISGSGDINANGLSAYNTDSKISGSGNVYTTVTNELDANITGSGNIYYKGTPTVSSQISGSGSVYNNN